MGNSKNKSQSSSILERGTNESGFAEIAKQLQASEFRNIITLAGAGISTAAGIPDFRSPGTGIYDNLNRFNLPYSQAIFELSYFIKRPEPFFQLAKDLLPGTYMPTKSHFFVKLLEEKGILLRHYTQNIDNLERLTGLAPDKLIEAHGTFYTSHCTNCHIQYSFEWLKNAIETTTVPHCTVCSEVVKPDIIFFGETLPKSFFERASSDFKKCDLLIVMGSSLSVHPFASLVTRVNKNCPRIIINKTQVGEEVGMKYDGSRRDIFVEGECDEHIERLVKLIGWEDALNKLSEHTTMPGISATTESPIP